MPLVVTNWLRELVLEDVLLIVCDWLGEFVVDGVTICVILEDPESLAEPVIDTIGLNEDDADTDCELEVELLGVRIVLGVELAELLEDCERESEGLGVCGLLIVRV